MTGPIGVDNSEVINIEQERELRRKNRKLYHNKADGEENETEQEAEDKINEQLL